MKLTLKEKLKYCFMIFANNSTLSYIFDLEERCKKANFAPFSWTISKKYNHFVWDQETIKIAEDWLNDKYIKEDVILFHNNNEKLP